MCFRNGILLLGDWICLVDFSLFCTREATFVPSYLLACAQILIKNRSTCIATDKRGYPHIIFLISRPRNKKDISIFRMKKKTPYLLLCT